MHISRQHRILPLQLKMTKSDGSASSSPDGHPPHVHYTKSTTNLSVVIRIMHSSLSHRHVSSKRDSCKQSRTQVLITDLNDEIQKRQS